LVRGVGGLVVDLIDSEKEGGGACRAADVTTSRVEEGEQAADSDDRHEPREATLTARRITQGGNACERVITRARVAARARAGDNACSRMVTRARVR
jgi:hypothetical protein